MKPAFLATTLICLSAGAFHTMAANPTESRYVIPSWGDMAWVYGADTDPAMDSERAIENMMVHWKARGFTGVFLRTDLEQARPGTIVRNPRGDQPNAALAVIWDEIDRIAEKCDPHVAARKAGEKVGFEYWMWHPYIYSEGAPPEAGEDGPGRMVPWSYARKYYLDHPEVITVDREGNKYWMVPEYAYPGARADKVAEFVHMAKTYRPTGIIASMRSEASQLQPPAEHGDQYGFNAPVVAEMKRLYNIDILTDPRFDWKSPSFNSADPMVENWRVLRGTYVTQLYREIHKALKEVDPKLQFAVALSGNYVGPVLGNWKLDWKTWIDEGIVDVIIVPVTFEATLDHDSQKKGYLTDVRHGKGTVSVEELKLYIAKSKHPNIRVIRSGAPSYFYPETAPEGADGWQCDVWYDSYHLAFYQRWEQWKQDIRDFGHIRFFEQNFDTFPTKSNGTSGGFGDGRHRPELRATPGVWYKLGDGSDGKPFAQNEIRRSDTGNAMLITTKELTGLHHSSPDRSRFTGVLDTAVTNGTATFDFWLYRDNEQSGISAHYTGDVAYEKDVGIRIAPRTGVVSYASGTQWTATGQQLPVKQWQRFVIEVNADQRTYSAYIGTERTALCNNVKYAPPKERFVSEHGVNIPIKVPSYRVFNVLQFIPADGAADNRVFLDDVSVRWKPTLHYAPRGATIALQDDFESHEPGSKLGTKTGVWRVETGKAKLPVIEKTTSYGSGTRCLVATAGTPVIGRPAEALAAQGKKRITVDLDVFLRSEKNFPYILPDPTTRSKHSAQIGLFADNAAEPFAAVDSSNHSWRIWDGTQYVDTGVVVTYDVWNHVQLAIDLETRTCTLVVQPVGELPTLVGTATLGGATRQGETLVFKILPSNSAEHLSAYDNLIVAYD